MNKLLILISTVSLMALAGAAGYVVNLPEQPEARAGSGGFQTQTAGSITINNTLVTSGTDGSILFVGSGKVNQDNANFFIDDSNNRLGLGTTTPAKTLSVQGAAVVSNTLTAANLRSSSSTLLMGFALSPAATSSIQQFFYVDRALTADRILFKIDCVGICASEGVVFHIRHAADMGSASTTAATLTTATLKGTSTTTIQTISAGFNDATFASGENVWVQVTDASSSPVTVGLSGFIYGTFDP